MDGGKIPQTRCWPEVKPKACKDCAHFQLNTAPMPDEIKGECRFYPPRRANYWPIVLGADWCSKFLSRANGY